MKKNNFLFIIFLIFLLNGLRVVLPAQEMMTLKTATSLALKKHPNIITATNQARIAENNAHVGNAALLPKVDLNGSAYYNDDEAASRWKESTRMFMNIEANYTFFDGFGNLFLYKKLQSGKKISQLEAQNIIESTLIEICLLFYNCAMAYDNYQIASELLDISKERYQRTQQGVKFGSMGKIELLTAEVDLNSDSVTFLQAQLNWNQSRRKLNLFMGRDSDINYMVDTSVIYNESHPLKYYHEKINDNTLLLLAKERVKQSQYAKKEAQSDFAPAIGLSASWGLGQLNQNLDFKTAQPTQTIHIGVAANLNLFNGFKNLIKTNNASIQLSNQEILLGYTRLSLKNELESLYETYINSKMVLELSKKNLEAAKLNFERSKELYYLGQLTAIRFREAQLNLIQVNSHLSRAKYELKINELKLQRVVGEFLKNLD